MEKMKVMTNLEWNAIYKLSYNVFGLGEVAEPKSQIEVQMFKIKNECL